MQSAHHFVYVGLRHSKFSESHGESYAAEKGFQTLDAFKGCGGIVRVAHIKHPACKLCYLARSALSHECHPRGENHSEPCPVGNIVHSADFVFDSVACPVFAASCAADAVMGECAAPHYIGARLIVFGVLHYLARLSDNGFQNAFAHPVGNLDIRRGSEVPFHDVSHHVGYAARCLIGRQRVCQLRVEQRELGAQHIVGAERYFYLVLGECNHRIAAALAAGGGNCEHNPDRQRLGRDALA